MSFTLEHIDENRHRIPRNSGLGMRTDVVVYASEKLLRQIENDLSLQQAVNVAHLPGIVGRAWRCRTSTKATDFRSVE